MAVEPGTRHRADRPQRRRQDHAVQRGVRAAPSGRGQVLLDGSDITRELAPPPGPARPRPHVPAAGAVHLADRCGTTCGWPATSATAGDAGRPQRDLGRRDRSGARAHGLARRSPTARSSEIPTGQARVVELARALMTRPTVLLLDEPAVRPDRAGDRGLRRTCSGAWPRTRHWRSAWSSTTCRWSWTCARPSTCSTTAASSRPDRRDRGPPRPRPSSRPTSARRRACAEPA